MNTMSGPVYRAETAEISPSPAPAAEIDPRLRTLAKLVAQFDRQNAVEAHTVYRVDGQVICVVARNGRTLFDTAEDFRMAGGLKPSDMAGDLGLSGERYMEYISKQIAENLKQRYADALQVARFEAGDAPAMGQLREAMFGITRERLLALSVAAALQPGTADLPQGITVFPKN